MSIFTTTAPVFFGTAFFSIYFCVALASDPPKYPDYVSVVSSAFRGFLPAVFTALVIYHFCVHHTLHPLGCQIEKVGFWTGGQIEKAGLWLSGCWVGALENYTFDRLPLQRLTPDDFKQPGAVLTLFALLILIIGIAFFQARAFRIEGRLPRYLLFYACLGILMVLLALIPHLKLRVHHYILALILLPGTALQTRPSLLYQGLLVGLFINGIARWGFDSILQTSGQLFKDDYHTLVPQIPEPVIYSNNNSIGFSWTDIPNGYDSMSVVVNDVERFRGSEENDARSFMWTRQREDEVEYFRFAYVRYGFLAKDLVGKFTKPGTWDPNGTWVAPEPSVHR